jgi:prepilin peptidase CpaA
LICKIRKVDVLMSAESLALTVLIVMLLLASHFDVLYRRVPNKLVVTGLILASASSWYRIEVPPNEAALGFIIAMMIYLPFYVANIMGAGDVKLLSVVGAFLGPAQFVLAAVFILIAGGAIALLYRVGSSSGVLAKDVPYALSILVGVGGYLFMTRQ